MVCIFIDKFSLVYQVQYIYVCTQVLLVPQLRLMAVWQNGQVRLMATSCSAAL